MDDTPENRILVDTLAQKRGFVITYADSPEAVGVEAETQIKETETPQGALLEGFLTGVTLEGKEELEGLVRGEPAQRKAELQRKKVEEERPVSFGAGKFIGGLIPSGLATAAGGALGGALAGPPGAIVGAGLGGAAAAGLESILEEPMGEKDVGYEDLLAGVIGGVVGGAGRAAAPLVRGIVRRISGKPLSQLSANEKLLKQQLDFLKTEKAKAGMYRTQIQQGKITGKQAMEQAKKNKAIQENINKLEIEIAKNLKDNFAAGIPVSGVEMIGDTPQMTPEEMREYEKLSVQEALEKTRKKKQTPVEIEDILF
jgi:hypothetical protein